MSQEKEEKDLEASIIGQISAEEEHHVRVAHDLANIDMQNKKLGLEEVSESVSADTADTEEQKAGVDLSEGKNAQACDEEVTVPITAPSVLAGESEPTVPFSAIDSVTEVVDDSAERSVVQKIAEVKPSGSDGVLTGEDGKVLAEPKNAGEKDPKDTLLGFDVDDNVEMIDTTTVPEYESYEIPLSPHRINSHSFRKRAGRSGNYPDLVVGKTGTGSVYPSTKPSGDNSKEYGSIIAPKIESGKHKRIGPYPNTFVSKFFQLLLVCCLPIIILWLSFRLVASSFFTSFEFSRLDPAEGLAPEVRQRFAGYALSYLFSNADKSYLEDLRLAGEPAFTASEISHMVDVKEIATFLTSMILITAAVAIMCIVVLNISDRRALTKQRIGWAVHRAFFWGAVSTMFIVAVAVVFVLLNWHGFFIILHEYLFPQGNWQFDSDSLLIRLFPEKFWYDAAVSFCFLAVLVSLLVAVFNWPRKRKQSLLRR